MASTNDVGRICSYSEWFGAAALDLFHEALKFTLRELSALYPQVSQSDYRVGLDLFVRSVAVANDCPQSSE
jgi:hypothetical protein